MEDTLEDYKDMKLKRAINVRGVTPRCCGSCKHHLIIDGFFLCRRENGYEGDTGEGMYWFHVCDGWSAYKRSEDREQCQH